METILWYGYLIGFFIYLAFELYYFYNDTRIIKGAYYAIYRGILVLKTLPMLLVWPYSMVVKMMEITLEKPAQEDVNRAVEEYEED